MTRPARVRVAEAGSRGGREHEFPTAVTGKVQKFVMRRTVEEHFGLEGADTA